MFRLVLSAFLATVAIAAEPKYSECGKYESNILSSPENETCWRQQMDTFSALLFFCAGNSPVTGKLPSKRPVTRSFDDFFELRLKKRLSKQWRRRWFDTPSRSLWRHCNDGILLARLSSVFCCKKHLHLQSNFKAGGNSCCYSNSTSNLLNNPNGKHTRCS